MCARNVSAAYRERTHTIFSEHILIPSFHRHVRISRMCACDLFVCVCVCLKVQIPLGVKAGQEITATGADFFVEEAWEVVII